MDFTKTENPTVVLGAEAWVCLRMPYYEAAFVDGLKQAVPLRAYDVDTKSWWFPRSSLPKIRSLLAHYWPTFKLPEGLESATAPPRIDGAKYRQALSILGLRGSDLDTTVHKGVARLREALAGSNGPLDEVEEAYLIVCHYRGMTPQP